MTIWLKKQRDFACCKEGAPTSCRADSPLADGCVCEDGRAVTLILVLLNSFNWTLDKRTTLPSWSETVISVIPKEGKNKMLCSSYRPISVLHEDYKLYASIMSKRLDSFIAELINTDQSGFVQGRQTQNNIRCSLYIIHNTKKI